MILKFTGRVEKILTGSISALNLPLPWPQKNRKLLQFYNCFVEKKLETIEKSCSLWCFYNALKMYAMPSQLVFLHYLLSGHDMEWMERKSLYMEYGRCHNEMEDFKNGIEDNFPYFKTNFILDFAHGIYRKIYTDSDNQHLNCRGDTRGCVPPSLVSVPPPRVSVPHQNFSVLLTRV